MLALYRTEPELEENARRNGMTYTRYVDDVHISSPRSVPPAAMTRIVGAMRSSLERHGFRPKREKQFVARPDRGMRVHNLNVSNAVSVPQKRRAQLRAAVFQLERRVETHSADSS